MPFPTLGGVTGASIEELVESLEKQRKEMQWLLQSLDTLNIKELNADVINAGTLNVNKVDVKVELSGQASISIDPTGFKGYDTYGEPSFLIDTNGNATFSGDIIASNITGSHIRGGTIEVDTDITIGNTLLMGVNKITQAIVFGNTGAAIRHYVDGGIELVSNWTKVGGKMDVIGDFNVTNPNSRSSFLGYVDFNGIVDFSGANVSGLDNINAGSLDGYYASEFAKGHTYGIGIAFNGNDRLYVRIHGSDVGHVLLSND